MSLSLKPIADRVIIEPVDDGNNTFAGGALVLPETAKEKPQQGIILSVGSGKKDDDGNRIPMDVEQGQRVLYAKYAGTEVKVDGKKFLILRESDVLAIIRQ